MCVAVFWQIVWTFVCHAGRSASAPLVLPSWPIGRSKEHRGPVASPSPFMQWREPPCRCPDLGSNHNYSIRFHSSFSVWLSLKWGSIPGWDPDAHGSPHPQLFLQRLHALWGRCRAVHPQKEGIVSYMDCWIGYEWPFLWGSTPSRVNCSFGTEVWSSSLHQRSF